MESKNLCKGTKKINTDEQVGIIRHRTSAPCPGCPDCQDTTSDVEGIINELLMDKQVCCTGCNDATCRGIAKNDNIHVCVLTALTRAYDKGKVAGRKEARDAVECELNKLENDGEANPLQAIDDIDRGGE